MPEQQAVLWAAQSPGQLARIRWSVWLHPIYRVCAPAYWHYVFFCAPFWQGSTSLCIDWHDTVYAARGGVSSAFAGGHQLQRTQGTGMPSAAERACENSDLRRLADPLAAISQYTSGHRAVDKALRRATAGATCLQATVSRNPSDLHCVCDGSQCQRVSARPLREHCRPSCVWGSTTLMDCQWACWFTANTHVCFRSCVLSCARSCYYTLSVKIPLTPHSLSLYLFPLCLSISLPLLLTVTCSLSVSISACVCVCLSLSLSLFCSLSLTDSVSL